MWDLVPVACPALKVVLLFLLQEWLLQLLGLPGAVLLAVLSMKLVPLALHAPQKAQKL